MDCLQYFNSNFKKPSYPLSFNEFHYLETKLFMKYFPKYSKNFYLPTRNALTKSKVKRMKIIRSFNAYGLHKSPEWRLLLSNKLKNIKSLHYGDQSPIQFIEKIKLFKSLESIKFSFPSVLSHPQRNQSEEDSLIKACRKMARLKKLKTLELDRVSKFSATLIQVLNVSPRLLSSLQYLGISCHWKGGRDVEMLEILVYSRHLLRKITVLELGALCSPSHHKAFENLENLCPNLRQLSFEFCCRDIIYPLMKQKRFSSQRFPVDDNFLSVIKTFHNLRSLELHIADTLTFLNDFAMPPLVEKLFLIFEECLSKDIMCKIDNTFTDLQALKIFEENHTLRKFYDNFQHLHDIKTLEIFLSSECDPEDYKYQNYLFQQILKRTRSLTKITFAGFSSCMGLNKPYFEPVQDFYFPHLLESCHHFSETLQTLEIGDEKIIFSNLNLNGSRNKFTNLSSIKISGTFNNPNLDIQFFLEQILSLGESITNIQLNTHMNGIIKPLLSLLRLQKPSKVKLELQIKLLDPGDLELSGINFENSMKEIEENQEKLHGVSLSLEMPQKNREHSEAFFRVYGKVFDSFNARYGYTPFPSRC